MAPPWKMHLKRAGDCAGGHACGATSGSWGRGAQPTCPVCKRLYTAARRHGDSDHAIRTEGITLPPAAIAEVVASAKRKK